MWFLQSFIFYPCVMRIYLYLLAGCHWILISVFRWAFRAPAPSSREVLSGITSETPVHFPFPPFRQGGSESILARVWLADFDFFSGIRQSDFIDFPEVHTIWEADTNYLLWKKYVIFLLFSDAVLFLWDQDSDNSKGFFYSLFYRAG